MCVLRNCSLALVRPDAGRRLSSGSSNEFVLLCRSCREFRPVKLLVLPVTPRPNAWAEHHDECVQRVYVGSDGIVCLGAQQYQWDILDGSCADVQRCRGHAEQRVWIVVCQNGKGIEFGLLSVGECGCPNAGFASGVGCNCAVRRGPDPVTITRSGSGWAVSW